MVILSRTSSSARNTGPGHGGQLMDYVIEFAQEKDFKRITLLTDRVSRPSQHCRRHGFVYSEMIPMRLVFDQPGER